MEGARRNGRNILSSGTAVIHREGLYTAAVFPGSGTNTFVLKPCPHLPVPQSAGAIRARSSCTYVQVTYVHLQLLLS